MLINLRNAMLAGKRLPYDAEVEYLESTGTQYIETGVIPDWNTKLSVTAAATATTEQFMGAIDASTNRFHFSFYSAGYFRGCVGREQISMGSANLLVHTFTIDAPNNTVSEDGTPYSFVKAGSVPSISIWLFGRNSNNPSYVRYIKIRICSCQIYQNGVLVRDFIPVRKGTVGYLYDRVSGKLFGNAGTGDFVLGQDVVPVEWLGFGGAQYFSTGVYATENTRIKARLKTISTGNRNWFGGSLTGSGGNASGYVFNALNSNSIEYLFGNGGWKTASSTGIVGKVFDLDFGKDAVKIDGTTISTPNYTAFDTQSAETFLGVRYGGSAYITGQAYWFDIYEGQTAVRKFLPVRVGTEGAMMDTLTRRIYRNAGTGAFGYGNDLKYPIPSA